MAASDEYLRRAVDEVLDPAWSHEHKRASHATIFRVAAGVTFLFVVATVAHLILNVDIPWVFFGIIALVGTTLAALMEWDDHTGQLHE
jgi:hypothetical protein